MVQLKDDCFAFGGELTKIDEALKDLEVRLNCICGTIVKPINKALGYILAEDIQAPRSVPPHNNSAVDGYAVYYDDLVKSTVTPLRVTGRVAAGHPLGRAAKRGEAIRVFTGAPIPIGADGGPDTIFMEEDCEVEGEVIIFPDGIKRNSNLRYSGEDVKKGSVIVSAGKRLRAQEIGLIASVGLNKVKVYKNLKVAIFSTGDEIFEPGSKVPKGCVFDANRFSIMGLSESLGCKITDLGILPDRLSVISNAIAEASSKHDLLITSGGISAGEEDHVRAAVQSLGSLYFWRFAIKPGRPVALGQIENTAFLGLPGNPVAAMITFMIIARPMIKILAGSTDFTNNYFQIYSNFRYTKKKGRREWVRVILETNKKGQLIAQKFPSSGSGILMSMVKSHGLVEIGEEIEAIDKGDLVNFLPFSEVMQ